LERAFEGNVQKEEFAHIILEFVNNSKR